MNTFTVHQMDNRPNDQKEAVMSRFGRAFAALCEAMDIKEIEIHFKSSDNENIYKLGTHAQQLKPPTPSEAPKNIFVMKGGW